MRLQWAVAMLLALLLPGYAAARQLTLDRVLASSIEHFPGIQAAVQEKLAREGRALAALGAFDLALEQESLAWASGYYDGLSMAQRVVKPLTTANARVFGGYRVANDDFPIYQQDRVTNDGGEFNLGLVLSLWRDREIDPRRFALLSTRLGVKEAKYEVLLAKVLTQRNAVRAYWSWVTAGLQVKVHERLVDLALRRMTGLEERVAAGDVAAIYVVENRQNLLRRQSLLQAAERDLAVAAIELSLYLRDRSGMPLQPPDAWLPAAFPPLQPAPTHGAEFVADVLARRAEFARLDIGLERERSRLRLAENELLPRVDLGLKAAHDVGAGSRSRQGFDAIVDLTLSIPLQRRRGSGLAAESRAKLRQLEFDRRLLEDRVANEIRKLTSEIAAAAEFVGITGEELTQAELLEEAERRRFAAGASDLFVVNLREERTADAHLRNLNARLGYFAGMNDYYAATVDLVALGI